MLQLKTFFFLCALVAMSAMLATQAHLIIDEPDCPPGNDTGDSIPDDKDGGLDDGAGLCDNFQALRATIAQDTLSELVQNHYQCNSKFRRALRFFNSTRFQDVIEQLQQSGAFEQLLQALHNASVDTTDIDNIMDIFQCVALPTPLEDTDCNCKPLRGHTFVGDVLAAMPKTLVHEYMTSEQAQDSNFAHFARAMTSRELQSRLERSLRQRELVRPLKLLRHNGWDLPQLLRAAQTILSW